MIKSFEDILRLAKEKGPKKIAVAKAEDLEVLHAVKDACDLNLIEPILVGEEDKIVELLKEVNLNRDRVEIVSSQGEEEAAKTATSLVSSGKADILMKGLLSTANIMRAVLNKETGLRTDNIISHVAVLDSPHYEKLLFMSDGAMNINPDLESKEKIMENTIKVAQALEIKKPKVALLSAVEKASDKMQSSLDAKEISDKNKGRADAYIEGPLALDNAISKDSARIKGIDSPVAGDADILIVPMIEAGNVLYKSLVFLGGSKVAGLIVGTKAPVVLTSRADNHEAKLYSIALAVLNS